MRNRTVSWTLYALFASLTLASPARALDIVTFTAPGVSEVAKDETLEILVGFDFDDLTVGGGFDLGFAPSLFSFQAFYFDSGLGDDPALELQPDFESSTAPY